MKNNATMPFLMQELVDPTKSAAVHVKINQPQLEGRDWACTVEFLGAGTDRKIVGYGIDGMQAFQNAVQEARLIAENQLKHLRLRSTGAPAAAAFPLSIPTCFGLALARRLERYVNGEVSKVIANMAKRKTGK